MSSKIQLQLNIYKYWCWLSVVIIFSATAIKPLKAQVIQTTQIPNHKTAQVPNLSPKPGEPPSNQPLPEQSPIFLPPPEELLQPPGTTTPIPESIPSGEVTQTLIVKKFQITGSTVFSPEDFEKITKRFTNIPITFAQLLQLRSEITKFYVGKGYITSGAYIPPQKLQNGVVEIKVVEGELEDIKVIGIQKLNPKYLQSRLALATKKPLNRDRLLEALQLLQLNPLIETLSAELSAGSRPGQSLLEVKITETNTFNLELVLDNGRSPAVGTFRRQIQVNEANLFGWGDSISATYANTDGSNVFDLNYTLPLNAHNGTLSFSYGFSNNQVIERPFDVLDIQSNSNYYEVSLRQPILQKPTQEFILGITASHRRSKATFLDGELPFPGTGTDAEGRTRVTAVRFFQEWVSRDSLQVFAMRSQLNVGLDLFDATINETFPDSRFVTWRGQAQWVRLLGRDTVLVLRGDVQLADRPLVPFEQIGIGGLDSVRGYRQDALLTDNGIFASAEVRIPVVRFSGRNNFLQVAPFVDFGNGWNDSSRSDFEVDLDSNTLLSVGLGLRLQLEKNLTARLDWGIPLISVTSQEKDSWQENGLYFSIIVNPF
ncbi:MAG: ShlB/FhaC/HecB family hemolysin secretion/activation protein [Hapalosiphonaceae cyanobacterium JJU2]|nr:MAG: ShlB/FhaC/HecB family hemolysin secretion/activation protein [Hapalosiphonaceae cyanobacterium JJU2]